MKELNKYHGHIALFVANLIFGLNTPITRTIVPKVVDPFVMTFFRMIGAAILFWTISIFTKQEKVPTKDIVLFFFAAVFAIVLNQTFFIYGLSKTSPIDASLVITLVPIVTMVLSAIFIKEPITFKKAIGVIIGASGAMILILGGSNDSSSASSLVGNLIVLSSVFSFAIYLSLFKDLISRYSPITAMKWMFLFAAILTLPVSYKMFIQTDFASFDTSVILRIGYVVVLATFFTYMLIPIGQKTLRPTTVSMYNYLQPIVASVATVIIGMDKFGVDKIISAVLVFFGVYLVTQSKSKADMQSENRVKMD